uniref:Uncharacterized protein n=1 Tax=Ditylenchus dipsaci TaxID=166011 RepID=A0A915DBC8_9BILA
MSAFGSLRPNNIKVKYTDSMEFGCAPDSNTFLSRQFQPNSSEKAGSTMIDQRRQIVQLIEGTEMKHSRLSECIIPKIFSTEEITTKTGADFGSFRPTVHESSGGYKMSEDERKLCALVIPYQTANF